MPTDDPRLERRLHDAAPVVDPVGVLNRVAQRRVRRRRTRRLELVSLALVVVLVIGATTVFVTRDDGSSPHVAAPGTQLSARIVDGDAAAGIDAGRTASLKSAPLDADPGVLRGPLFVGTFALSVASYDRGSDGSALSHVVRVDGTHVVDVVDFKAEVISITEGEGARWALTRNLRASGGTVPDSFLKRIPRAGDPVSTQLPLNADPVGPVAAVGGAVWVPVRDGLLQFGTDGNFVRHIGLPDASARWIALVGKAAYVTDGDTLRRLDSVQDALADPIRFGPDIIGLASAGFDGRVLLRNERGGREQARVARATSTDPVEVTAVLPTGFAPDGLVASTTRVWATGTVAGAPAIALLGDRGVVATIILENASDGAALAWTAPHTVSAVSDGRLYEIRVS